MPDKLVSLSDAIAQHVVDGASVVIGAGLEVDIPFAAVYEIIRQGIGGLDLISPISDAATDMLIGAGCCAAVTSAWVGNVSGGLGHNYRRACENREPRKLTVHDHSNLSLGFALMAGAYGMPYAAVRSVLGSDILNSNPHFIESENPFKAGEKIVLVAPLIPDVAILAAHRADAAGNNHQWGSAGVTRESALAAEKVIILADEIVEPEVIASDPGRVMAPGHLVTAVCHVPAAVHPSPMTGRWRRDSMFFNEYHHQSRTREGFLRWLDEWVLGLADHAAYRGKLGARLDDLRMKTSAPAAGADYAAV